MDWECGDAEAADRGLVDADVVVRQRLVNQRLIPSPMEARGAAADYDPGTGSYTVWMSSQCPHVMRLLMTAFVFGIPETKMRCISPTVGGAFGAKIFLYPEYVLVAAVAEKHRPAGEVDRVAPGELRATTHGRDHITYLEIGAKRDGTFDRAQSEDVREPRRHHLDDRARHPDDALRTDARRRLQDPGDLTARCSASTRIRAWSTPTAAPGGPRRPM